MAAPSVLTATVSSRDHSFAVGSTQDALHWADWMQEELDFAYENELQVNPFEQRVWWKYIQSKEKSSIQAKFLIYERALKRLPGSYKIWWNYLQDRVKYVSEDCITFSSYEVANNAFERCLIHHSRMPRIWLDYCEFLVKQRFITRTRRTYDRALRSLPITQHHRIWQSYLRFVSEANVLKMSLCVYRRYLLLEPDHVEDLIDLLNSEHAQLWDEAAVLLGTIVNDEYFVSPKGKTHHQLWMELCDLITQHPAAIRSLRVEPILRAGIRKFTDEVGRLWCSLADHFIRLGLLEKARDVYEEAMATLLSLQDFAMVFDAFTAFEESILTNLMASNTEEDEVKLHFARLEDLLDRRPELVSSVKLRQNPHNVYEWLNRTQLYNDDPVKIIQTFSEAVKTVEPDKAMGKLSSLWIKFAKFYESHEDIEDAEVIYSKATDVNFKTVDELATVWCEWIEMELRYKQYSKALEVARRSISRVAPSSSKSAQLNLHRSVKLWSLVMDLEESLGTFETLRICFDKMHSLKVLTPQMIINYAHYLEEERYFEESFKVYERGIALFRWPHLNDLWLMYLTKFVGRYGAKKIERARELFEQAIDAIPPPFAKRFYLLYAKLEEEFGLAKHALRIYHEATKAVKTEERLQVYNVYIAKTVELFGIAKTRTIYEEAIQILPDDQVRQMSLQYAQVEKGLGEIDRARAIYQHASQFCDPNREIEFWKVWREFEVVHGNEDTFRDMLRMKRSVLAQYSQIHFNAAELVAEATPTNPMAEAEQQLEEKKEAEKRRVQMEMEIAEKQQLDKRKKQEEEDVSAAEREYQQLQASRQVTQSNSSKFIASSKFEGFRPGYVFQHGDLGLGYYQEAPFAAPSNVPNEEMDIDVDDFQLEIQRAPSEVYGSLSEHKKASS